MTEKKEQVINKNTANYEAFSKMTQEEVLNTFKSQKEGLTTQKAEDLREEFGENVISHGKKTPFIVEALKAYFTPFTKNQTLPPERTKAT